jgi:hypothetical protein
MLRLPGDAVELSVADVGAISLPVRAAQAKRLIAVARPALFGRREETLSDSSVRDTWELTPAQVTLGGPEWDAHLEAALAHFRDQLGLPAGSRLRAELHSLLVYGKGQFFLPHQDSEKHDEMVATLVVSLPSVHGGGELVIDDGGVERTHRGSRDDVVLVAFYSDRRHEVRPVRSGYRVTLTFNLMLTAAAPSFDAGPVEQSANCLTEHFTSPATSQYGDRDLGEPTPPDLPARPRVQPEGSRRAALQGRRRRTGPSAPGGSGAGRMRDRARPRRDQGDLGRGSGRRVVGRRLVRRRARGPG